MNVEQRVDLMERLGKYLSSESDQLTRSIEMAQAENPWFIPQFIQYQLNHISSEYLNRANLESLIKKYGISPDNLSPKTVGVVMAGNIPVAGFHDFLSVFISGHHQVIKPSSKDFELITFVVRKLNEWEPSFNKYVSIAERLKGCDAYIATGSNNSSRYFDYYFNKFPHIIRRNRTSAAILTGDETVQDLEALADDIYIYFGLGCRNVTKLYVPKEYDFVPLLESLKKYNWTFDVHKYKNNYDYQLAIMIINRVYYMTNGSILIVENKGLFSPVSQLHFEYYDDVKDAEKFLKSNSDIQCVVGKDHIPFGKAQQPALTDYADKTDTLQFLRDL